MDLEDTVFGAAFPEDAATGSTVHSRQAYAPAVVEARGASGLVGLSNQFVSILSHFDGRSPSLLS